jgi:hypothetical protein
VFDRDYDMLDIGYVFREPCAVGMDLADEYEALRPTLPYAMRKVCRDHVGVA